MEVDPTKPPYKQPKEVPISPEELQDILENHRKWVESGKKEGGIAILDDTNLQGAQLQKANLTVAWLEDARLSGAQLQDANLEGANLYGAHLRGANIEGAQMHNANLFLAGFEGASGINVNQIRQARAWKLAKFDKEFLSELGLPPDHNKRVIFCEFSNYDFSGTELPNLFCAPIASFKKANLRGANLAAVTTLSQEQLNEACVDEHTKLPEGLNRPKPCSVEEVSKK